jgi:hypothetical protein
MEHVSPCHNSEIKPSQYSVVGSWNLSYDWNCDGSTGLSVTQINSNNTFSSNWGDSGTWSLTGSQFNHYPNGTIYWGTINAACNYMNGTMRDYNGTTGCWTASRSADSQALEKHISQKSTEIFGPSGKAMTGK